MKELGAKFENEMKPGSYVLSNVFTIPGWKPLSQSSDGTYLYHTPHCWSHQTESHSATRA